MDRFGEALRTYLGMGRSPFPMHDPGAVVDRWGEAQGAALASRAERLLAEVAALQPDWKAHTLVSATDWAEGMMRSRHSDLDDDAIAALGWAFSYRWK